MCFFCSHEIRIEIPYSIIRNFLLIALTKISLSWNLSGQIPLKLKIYLMKKVKEYLCALLEFSYGLMFRIIAYQKKKKKLEL